MARRMVKRLRRVAIERATIDDDHKVMLLVTGLRCRFALAVRAIALPRPARTTLMFFLSQFGTDDGD